MHQQRTYLREATGTNVERGGLGATPYVITILQRSTCKKLRLVGDLGIDGVDETGIVVIEDITVFLALTNCLRIVVEPELGRDASVQPDTENGDVPDHRRAA